MKNLYNFNDWTDVLEHQKIGEILLQSEKINLIHLGMALDIQKFQKKHLGEIFVNMKVLSQKDLDCALVLQSKIDDMILSRGNNEL